MVRKLFRTGNSLAVAVPGAAAAALGLAEGDYVRLEHDTTAGVLLLWPYARRERLGVDSEYVQVVGEFLRDYGPALAALEQISSDALASPGPADGEGVPQEHAGAAPDPPRPPDAASPGSPERRASDR